MEQILSISGQYLSVFKKKSLIPLHDPFFGGFLSEDAGLTIISKAVYLSIHIYCFIDGPDLAPAV
jgi:hypothetical protein